MTKYFFLNILRAFGKLRKATNGFVMSVRPSSMEQPGSDWADFHDIWYLDIFRKNFPENISIINPLNTELNPICQ